MKLFDSLLRVEIYQILYVQDVFSRYEEFLAGVTRAFDPKILFLTVIPLVAGLSTTLYSKLLLSVLLTEYANTFAKWVLAEDRPFWWLNETKEFTSLNRPKIYQNELTCEPSPGNPSGHLMTSTTYLFVIFSVLEEYLRKYGRVPIIMLRIAYYTTLFFISVSRMYFGCHFLHQCIFGVILGIGMSKVCLSHRLEKYIVKQSGKKRVGFVVLICLILLGLYWIQKLMGIDPQWAVKMAFKWCDDPFYLKPTTTLVFSIIRLTGALLAFAMVGPVQKAKPLNMKLSIPMVMAMLAFQWIALDNTPRYYGVVIYYLYSLVVNFIFTYGFLRWVPALAGQEIRVSRKSKTN
ncbi:glucose-6-phosphatase 2 [Anopheles ziemanni]|uniref:glucose-6-phosphatase 2 n=1 Tax=Anopheles coustani TaxID=139045 RepID=UPI00265A8E8A|nr:glucose-6-phosphatase 2 [Anopheles coustani]XP_058123651.1 glucose-6-phosphatase 2 [Anopheles coustani]XP_058167250.1 glucose-6-phosphatase 2 [Anopheles ziemanni]